MQSADSVLKILVERLRKTSHLKTVCEKGVKHLAPPLKYKFWDGKLRSSACVCIIFMQQSQYIAETAFNSLSQMLSLALHSVV